MNYSFDTITHSTTGVKTMTVGFQPLEAELVIAPAPGGALTTVKMSSGTTDGTNQSTDSFSVDSTRRYQERFTDRMASIWEWNGAAWAEVFKITFDSFTSTEFKYNVNIGNANYQVKRKVRG